MTLNKYNRKVRLFLFIILIFVIWRTIFAFHFNGVVFITNILFWGVLSLSLGAVLMFDKMLKTAKWMLFLSGISAMFSGVFALYSGISGITDNRLFATLAIIVGVCLVVSAAIVYSWQREIDNNSSGIDILR